MGVYRAALLDKVQDFEKYKHICQFSLLLTFPHPFPPSLPLFPFLFHKSGLGTWEPPLNLDKITQIYVFCV